MYILIHAVKNLWRNRGRTLLLLILTTLIITLSAVSMLLQDHAKQSAAYYASTYGSKVSILSSSKETIDNRVLLSFRKSSLLHSSELTGAVSVLPKECKVLDASDNGGDYVKWIATNQADVDEGFASKEKKLIEGSMFTKPNEVIISKRFAELNGLHVNDQITLTNQNKTESIVSTIVGIYNNMSLQADLNMGGTSYTNEWNTIYSNWETLQESRFFPEAALSIALFLKQPDDLSALRNELIEKGMPETYLLSQDTATYEQKMQPIRQLQELSSHLMMAVIGVGGMLLVIVSIMAIRERIYEVGVLRAMGMKKAQIARSFLYEAFVDTFIALLFSICIASLFAPWIIGLFMNQDEVLKEMVHVRLTMDMILHCSLLSLGLALISSISGLFVIMRYEPRKILTQA